jgi:hypothetical protein
MIQDKDQWLALLNMVMNLRVPYKAENVLNSWVTISFSRRILFHGVCYLLEALSPGLTIHLHLILRLRMRGALPPLHQASFMAWCLRHRDNFASICLWAFLRLLRNSNNNVYVYPPRGTATGDRPVSVLSIFLTSTNMAALRTTTKAVQHRTLRIRIMADVWNVCKM